MKILIIGNGIAGSTSARNIRKYMPKASITMVSSETELPYSRTALMYVFMQHMPFKNTELYPSEFWKKNSIRLIQDVVQKIDYSKNCAYLEQNGAVEYDYLVLATGSNSNRFNWPGQDLNGVFSLYNKQDLNSITDYVSRNQIKKAVIVGGGLIGVELAEMLHSRGVHIDFLVREPAFWGNVLPSQDASLIQTHLEKEHHLNILTDTNLVSIHSNTTNGISHVVTDSGKSIECDFVGLTTGVSPNTQLTKNTEVETDRGILVDAFLRTSISNVFAIGDCAQVRSEAIQEAKSPQYSRRSIEAVWYVGKMMGETVARTISGKPTEYKPGIWFNSAKFFDIEYQTYGSVLSTPSENESVFHWKHPLENISISAVFHAKTHVLHGINVFGIRLRHETMQAHLSKLSTVEQVLADWKNIDFNPEFFPKYGNLICAEFEQQFKTAIQLKSKSWLSIL